MIKAIVCDYSTLFVNDLGLVARVRSMLEDVRALGLQLAVMSTNPQDFEGEFAARDYPPFDLTATRADVGVAKGSGQWIAHIAKALNLQPNELVVLGDDRYAWNTALNAPCIYLDAAWCEGGFGAPLFRVQPEDLRFILSHFLLRDALWEYKLDAPASGLKLRVLLDKGTRLTRSGQPSTFELTDVFRDRRDIPVGRFRANEALILHALTNLYLEGLVTPDMVFAVYPSSTPGNNNPMVEAVLEIAPQIFKGHSRDVLVRGHPARNTSESRGRKGQPAITLADQIQSVHIAPNQKILQDRSRRVVVFDDFTTDGNAVECTRNLLRSAGITDLVFVTVGRFKQTHYLREPLAGVTIDPYSVNTWNDGDFSKTTLAMSRDFEARTLLTASFEALANSEAVR